LSAMRNSANSMADLLLTTSSKKKSISLYWLSKQP
jgi:hypothetical protein